MRLEIGERLIILEMEVFEGWYLEFIVGIGYRN